MSCNNTPFGYPTANNDCCTDVLQYARFAYSSAQSAYANATEFNKVYLGSFATPPTVDNQGDPLQEGALYYNTSSDEMRVWNGSAWVRLIDIGGDLTINTVRVGLGSGNIGSNTVVGTAALSKNTTGYNNTAIGFSVLAENTTGVQNTAVGVNALNKNTSGANNVAHGVDALINNTIGQANTAVGTFALSANTIFSNVGGFGYNAQVSADNEIRIGNTEITAVVSQIGSWSDERDKADIRDTVLGLDFIKELRPVDYKWDYREDYRPEAPASVSKPAELKEDASDGEKAKYAEELAAYNAYKVKNDKWLEDCKWSNLVHDGTHKRTRFHHGLIAQEVKALIERTGVDFGGFQDHTIKGGDAVMTIGYTELIGPLIKAVQELSAEVNSLKAQLQS
jgi:hypothetical protein